MIDNLLKTELEPCFTREQYNQSTFLQKFCVENYVQTFICRDCNEQCIIKNGEQLHCQSGEIDCLALGAEKFLRYQFSLKKFAQEVIAKNGLKEILKKDSEKTYTIGEKTIDEIICKIVYARDLTDKRGKIKDIAVQRLRVLKTSQSRLIVITPDKFINDSTQEALLYSKRIEILQLDELSKTDFLIEIKDFKEYDLKVNADKMTISLYGVELDLSNSVETFAFIYNLALKPKDILSVEQVRNMKKSHQNDKTLMEASTKLKQRLIGSLKTEFKKENISSDNLDNLIAVISKNEQFYLNIDKDKVKIIGQLPT